MQMPEGTVFFKVDLDELHCLTLFEGQAPMIKQESIKDDGGEYIDFFYTAIGWGLIPVAAATAADVDRLVPYMLEHPDEDVEFVHVGSRDGCFDGDEVRFAVLSDGEVQDMIILLMRAQRDVKHPGHRQRMKKGAFGVVVPKADGGLEVKEI